MTRADAKQEREMIARLICYWSPGTCHDAICLGACHAVRPEKWTWRAAHEILSTTKANQALINRAPERNKL